ncbi:MAG: flagellar biosynthetic protein FliO [Clostridiales bacterium]|nr:flagellar biosynthetic protein FliO [Clostridiales bacterium]
MSDGFTAFGSMIGFFLLMILIFVGAYYATRWMGRHYTTSSSSSQEMRVVDKLALSREQYLLIVETGGKTLLLGVSPQRIENLAELDSEAFTGLPPVQDNTDFISMLKNRMKKPENPGKEIIG